jgi:hypothetical protein
MNYAIYKISRISGKFEGDAGARRGLGQHIASNWCFGHFMVFH